MKSFFKIFFATLVSLVIFSLIVFFLFVGWVAGITSRGRPTVEPGSVLVLDLSQDFKEQRVESPLSTFASNDEMDIPGLYDVVRLIKEAREDKDITGIYIIANSNPNGFASNEEIRNALIDFKTSKKFVIAHGDVISQKAYDIANVADKVYLNPTGMLEWTGFNVDYVFLKGALDKLEIQPQIFYAGKFKSATEPFRTDKMTPENKMQTTVWLTNLYNHFLMNASLSRNIDTATLFHLANDGKIQTAQDALDNKLVDGLKYDDQVKDEIKNKLRIGKYETINFITINKYAKTGSFKRAGTERIAVIYAQGDIVDGSNEQPGMIASENYMKLIRKARLDQSIKAIVFRVNSGGGSSLASENIWRELFLAKQEKPVVVSFGDVAASGGYYISCAADSIFAEPNTITGSIGVFGIIPNMETFFKDKLGVTFDGVKTGQNADAGIFHPLNENEKKMIRQSVENTYKQFKERVGNGRKKDTAFIESIAQGRVWSGEDAIKIGLIDHFGGLQDAIDCAARLAKTSDYRLREFPEPQNIFDRIFGSSSNNYSSMIKKDLGEDNFKVYQEMVRIKQMTNTIQARLPFEFLIH
ncbi:MAG: signal peptide peptidase SppA [Chitinophagales bacterium]